MSNKQPPAHEPTPAYEPPALTSLGTVKQLTLYSPVLLGDPTESRNT